jgi:uncharacterized protein (DUF1684 family)
MALVAGASLLGSGPPDEPAAAANQAYIHAIQQWHEERDAGLRAENGWLTLVGLHWLRPGDNPFGSDPSLPVALPAGLAPALAGTLILDEQGVTLVPATDASLLVNGEPATRRLLRDDLQGEPDILSLGRLRMHMIRRGQRHALRVRDGDSALRRQFTGIQSYPVNPAWRLEARWEAYEEPRLRQVPTVTGTPAEMLAIGRAHFTIDGQALSLEPVLDSLADKELFFVFKDETTGRETYAGGRFLYSQRPRDGKLVLDFNKAYNPPCVFTPYATCPLPPPENALPVPVRAGEKNYHSN